MKAEKGQLIILAGVLILVILFGIALFVEGSRMILLQNGLSRSAETGGKAGLILVGDHMVTQFIAAQLTATSPCLPENPYESVDQRVTQVPGSDNFYEVLNEDHRKTLVAPPMQTMVVARVKESVQENISLKKAHEDIVVEVIYPENYQILDSEIFIFVKIYKPVDLLFFRLQITGSGGLIGEARQSIKQR